VSAFWQGRGTALVDLDRSCKYTSFNTHAAIAAPLEVPKRSGFREILRDVKRWMTKNERCEATKVGSALREEESGLNVTGWLEKYPICF